MLQPCGSLIFITALMKFCKDLYFFLLYIPQDVNLCLGRVYIPPLNLDVSLVVSLIQSGQSLQPFPQNKTCTSRVLKNSFKMDTDHLQYNLNLSQAIFLKPFISILRQHFCSFLLGIFILIRSTMVWCWALWGSLDIRVIYCRITMR